MLKTHNCGDLRVRDVGERVTLAGWVHRRRDHGGVTFIDLRDRAGVVQIVFHPDAAGADPSLAALPGVRGEYVLRVTGDVVERAEETRNANLGSGDVEVQAATLEILNEAKTPPFAISDDIEVDEMLRLQYRYIDLRRPAMVRAIEMRHGMNQYIRNFMTSRAFSEVETPIMVAATPEGARDYLVPSRLHHGRLLRAAPVAAAAQAAADGRRAGALLPDRALLPRRGPARRPPARVHPARHRGLLRRGGRHPDDDGGAVPRPQPARCAPTCASRPRSPA